MGRYSIDYGYKKSFRLKSSLIIAANLLLIGLVIYGVQRIPLGQSRIKTDPLVLPSSKSKITTPISWPKYGQSAYGEVNNGVLAVSDDAAKPVPVASLAKVITALAVMREKPLEPGQKGPTLTLSKQDVDNYHDYVRKSGAVVYVEAGQQVSQRDAMEAMLMTSANNVADTLAKWSFGSVEAYNEYANKMVREMGLHQTTVADASGYSPGSISTAHDMVELGIQYMKNPVLRDIAAKKESKIPLSGAIRNYNSTINKNGILGLKVGNTDEAGRCFLVAEERNRGGGQGPVAVAVVLGAENIRTAMEDSKKVLHSGNEGFDLISSR